MNAFMVSQQRTGSTLLYEFLDSHPGIFCADELFIIKGKIDYRFRMIKVYNWYKKTKGWTTQEFLRWVFSLSQHSCIKILYHQIEWFKLHNEIFQRPAIHLTRNNHFKRVVSQFMTADKINRQKPQTYIDEMNKAIKNDQMWGNTLKEKCPKYLKLSFENLVGRHENVRNTKYTFCKPEVGKKLCDFFGVPYFEMFTATEKALKKKDYWEYIPKQYRKTLREELQRNFKEGVWK